VSPMIKDNGTTALLVIDMQTGLFEGEPPRHDAQGTVRRINAVARAVRATGGIVIFIQHEDKVMKPNSDAWQLLPALERSEADLTVRKKACDHRLCHRFLRGHHRPSGRQQRLCGRGRPGWPHHQGPVASGCRYYHHASQLAVGEPDPAGGRGQGDACCRCCTMDLQGKNVHIGKFGLIR
jgi:hypothetical protein